VWLALCCIARTQAYPVPGNEASSMSDVALVVNAGGVSKRMAAGHKALLPVPPHGFALINHIIDRLSRLATSGTIVVANDTAIVTAVRVHQGQSCTVVPDRWPQTGAMGGLATGLLQCTGWAMVVACDMPFVSPRLFRMLRDMATEDESGAAHRWDAVVPRVRGFPHMMHAVYHASAVPQMEAMIHADNLKLLDLLPRLSVRYVGEEEMAAVDPELRSLTNVNTDEDWADALQHAAWTSNP